MARRNSASASSTTARTQADIARALLEKAGHAVTRHPTPSEDALREIPARPPDRALADIMMPAVDGYELCRRLRGIRSTRPTKLIVMSTKAYPFERKRAFDLGASGYFVKPLHPGDVRGRGGAARGRHAGR